MYLFSTLNVGFSFNCMNSGSRQKTIQHCFKGNKEKNNVDLYLIPNSVDI